MMNKASPSAHETVDISSYNGEHLIKIEEKGFQDAGIRRAFIRKVYTILCAQFLVSIAVILGMQFTLKKNFHRDEALQNRIFIAQWVCLAVFLVIEIILVCFERVRRKHPINIIALAIFTFALSGFTGCITLYYDFDAVLIAMGSTFGITLGLTLFACQTKIDFTSKITYLVDLVLVFLCFGAFSIIFWGKIMQVVFGMLGVLVFSLFLVYDTQLIIGGKLYYLSEEEYVCAALSIYIDVIQIFFYSLPISGSH